MSMLPICHLSHKDVATYNRDFTRLSMLQHSNLVLPIISQPDSATFTYSQEICSLHMQARSFTYHQTQVQLTSQQR